jgi:hypothetical protein
MRRLGRSSQSSGYTISVAQSRSRVTSSSIAQPLDKLSVVVEIMRRADAMNVS